MTAFVVLVSSGCSRLREQSGSSLVLDVNPRPPAFAGAYDFDLLGRVGGKSCISRSLDGPVYWVGITDLAKFSEDPLTRSAIAAAAYDAISGIEDVDTIVVTRVITEGKGPHRVCATVIGRGVRLKKAQEPLRAPADPRENDLYPRSDDSAETDEDAD